MYIRRVHTQNVAMNGFTEWPFAQIGYPDAGFTEWPFE
jgi:hypothetical protein